MFWCWFKNLVDVHREIGGTVNYIPGGWMWIETLQGENPQCDTLKWLRYTGMYYSDALNR